MPVFRDLDRLNVAIRNDLMSLIKNDSLGAINEATVKINDVIESTDASGELKTIKTDRGASIRADIDVPIDNAAEFALKVDGAIKSTFRFGKWSDMKVS